MDGVTAPIDGGWQPPQVATILVRQLAPPVEEPTLGAILACHAIGVLGPAEELAVRVQQVIHEAGWARLPSGESVGDGAPWSWHVVDAYVPGGRPTLDYAHLSEPL